jgi:integrase/recombinase XerD
VLGCGAVRPTAGQLPPGAAVSAASPLQLAQAARIMREATKDKSYQLTPLGQDVAGFLRIKRKSLARNTLLAYESTLAGFARAFADLELRDFEPPVGVERLEEWLDGSWGKAQPGTYNRHLATMREFFKFQIQRGRMHGDPTLPIERAKKRDVYRTTFTDDQCRAILAGQRSLRDRIALRLLLHYGVRRGTLQAIQIKHFDHVRRRLTVFLKGGKVRTLPIPEPAFWLDLERHILDSGAEPGHYLMAARWRNRYGSRPQPTKPMSVGGLHRWWYRCLANAGIVPEGTTSGERMHKARHTAGQTVLDRSGNLKAVQKMLGHESIRTTGDIYVDYDADELATLLSKIYEGDG